MTAVVMMLAGHETSANMISLGTLALIQHRDVFERLGQQRSSRHRDAVEDYALSQHVHRSGFVW